MLLDCLILSKTFVNGCLTKSDIKNKAKYLLIITAITLDLYQAKNSDVFTKCHTQMSTIQYMFILHTHKLKIKAMIYLPFYVIYT